MPDEAHSETESEKPSGVAPEVPASPKERAIVTGTRALLKYHEGRRAPGVHRTRHPPKQLSFWHSPSEELVVTSYHQARLLLGAVTRAVARKNLSAAQGSTIVQAVKTALYALEAEEQKPGEEKMAMRFRVVLDEKGSQGSAKAQEPIP
jgi:hypothetical protein